MIDESIDALEGLMHEAHIRDFINSNSPKSIKDIVGIAKYSNVVIQDVRKQMVMPDPSKTPPTFSLVDIAKLCKIDKAKASAMLIRDAEGLPKGVSIGGNKKLVFTLSELHQWVDFFAPYYKKPQNLPAKKICVGNFKGGVTKTTTAVCTAQGLSLRGRRVLILDLDPQGSATSVLGVAPYPKVQLEHTIMPYIYGDEESLEYAVRSTYWDGIDLIPASGLIAHAEFHLPVLQASDPTFEFWEVINEGLEPLLNKYDVIIFDTPPALSYLTINALMAADALIVPSPPNAMDYTSSVQFWSLFSDISNTFARVNTKLNDKKYDFINVLMCSVNNTRLITGVVKDWIKLTYREMVMPVEISFSSGPLTAASEFATVFDMSSYTGKNKIFLKTREEFDAFIDIVDGQLVNAWKRDDNHE